MSHTHLAEITPLHPEKLSLPGNRAREARRTPYGLPPVMTVSETAVFLRMNVKTVYAGIRSGDIPGRRVGRRHVVLRDALLKWMQERVLPAHRRRR